MNPNLKKEWDTLSRTNMCPQLFLDLSFYWMIGAALQRRVWYGSHTKPLIPSMYVTLCAPPGIGKGLCIYDIINLMDHHKFRPAGRSKTADIDSMIEKALKRGDTPETIQLLRDSKRALEEVDEVGEKKEAPPEQLLFPRSADSTTFEALTRQHAKANRVFHAGQPTQMAPSGLYVYRSMNIIVEDSVSMLNKDAKKISDYFLSAFNAQDYKYLTKHQGTDTISKLSLAMLLGATPEHMSQAIGSDLVGGGFTSRVIFAYADKARWNGWEGAPPLEHDQLAARDRILKRLLELSKLFGQVTYSPEVRAFMDDIYKQEVVKVDKNKDPRLVHYYSRHALHLQKLALCVHFTDNDSLEVQIEPFMLARNLLIEAEKSMHLALSLRGRNPLGELQRRVLKYIMTENKEVNFKDIYIQFVDDANEMELTEAVNFLVTSGKLVKAGLRYKSK